MRENENSNWQPACYVPSQLITSCLDPYFCFLILNPPEKTNNPSQRKIVDPSQQNSAKMRRPKEQETGGDNSLPRQKETNSTWQWQEDKQVWHFQETFGNEGLNAEIVYYPSENKITGFGGFEHSLHLPFLQTMVLSPMKDFLKNPILIG